MSAQDDRAEKIKRSIKTERCINNMNPFLYTDENLTNMDE
jgi:hypothetical protein